MTKLGGERAKFGARLRPLRIHGTAGSWRLPSRLNQDMPSDKVLIPYNHSTDRKMGAAMAAVVICNPYGIKVATKVKRKKPRINGQTQNHSKAKKLDHHDDDENDEGDDPGRNIGAFPGSPSFRVFFEGDSVSRNTHDQEE